MEYRPLQAEGFPEEWQRLCALWLALPSHPDLLAALARGRDDTLLLRYAAVNWSYVPPITTSVRGQSTIATWGMQLTECFRAIAKVIDEARFADLARPILFIDLGEHARVGFLPIRPDEAHQLPPELLERRVRCDERTLVFAVGQLLSEMCGNLDGVPRLGRIVERCLEKRPNRRFRTLDDLCAAWTALGVKHAVREGPELEEWQLVEEGFGWIAAENEEAARSRFQQALLLNPTSRLAKDGLKRVDPEYALSPRVTFPGGRRFRPRLQWQDVAERAVRLETARDFTAALDLYNDVKLDGTNDFALYLAIACCQLALGAGGIAIDYAGRALEIDDTDVFALALRTRGYLLDRRLPEALGAADAWLAAHPRDAEAHHSRGRALFALGRYSEARASFERACVLAPDLVESQLLRREADRAMRRVRDTVGTQPPLELTLPEHLAHLRDAVAAGRIGDVIDELERPEHDKDPIAKLARARCLAFERRFDEALAVLDDVARWSSEHAHEALLEKAHVLLALDRAAEALPLFERSPNEMEAIEGRVLALRRLGRDHEADEQLARALGVANNLGH